MNHSKNPALAGFFVFRYNIQSFPSTSSPKKYQCDALDIASGAINLADTL